MGIWEWGRGKLGRGICEQRRVLHPWRNWGVHNSVGQSLTGSGKSGHTTVDWSPTSWLTVKRWWLSSSHDLSMLAATHHNIKCIWATTSPCSTMCASRAPPLNCSWVCNFFKNHQKLAQKSQEAYSGMRGTHNKPKLFCKLCLAHRVNMIMDQDAKEVEADTWQAPWTAEMIEMVCVTILNDCNLSYTISFDYSVLSWAEQPCTQVDSRMYRGANQSPPQL